MRSFPFYFDSFLREDLIALGIVLGVLEIQNLSGAACSAKINDPYRKYTL